MTSTAEHRVEGAALVGNLAIQPRILEHLGDQAGDRFEQRHLGLAEQHGAIGRVDHDQPDRLAIADQRRQHQRRDPAMLQQIAHGFQAGIGAYIGDDLRAAQIQRSQLLGRQREAQLRAGRSHLGAMGGHAHASAPVVSWCRVGSCWRPDQRGSGRSPGALCHFSFARFCGRGVLVGCRKDR